HEAAWAMERIMSGEATHAQFGAFVAALRAKGETVEEIAGFVATMRRMAVPVPAEGPLVDTCGTGGDRSGTVNASTMAAFVGARHQALGVSDRSMAPKMADVLSRTGSVHALVLHGSDGLDEITLSGPTLVWELQGGRVTESVIDPGELGLAPAEPEALRGGSP